VGKDNITSLFTNITTSLPLPSHLVYGRGRDVVIFVNKDVILSYTTLYKGGEERL
jgi:hypothetical protein